MKLVALRLAEFGPFFDGVAVAGLAGGLNVLIGPNERGKSTLLRALNVVFGEAHTAANKTVKGCRSYRGGAPLVEVEFELDGRSWRLRKRFLSGRSAELIDLASGRTWRNSEAEDCLDDLLKAHLAVAGARGLLWVEQTKSFSVPIGKEGDELGGALGAFVRDQVAAAAGGDLLAKIKTETRAVLEVYVTANQGRPKKGGPLAVAMALRDRLSGELSAARDAFRQGEERARDLAEYREREREFQVTALKSDKQAQIVAAQQALDAAEAARQKVATLDYKVQACEAVLATATQKLERAQESMRGLERAAKARGDLIAEQQSCTRSLGEAAQAFERSQAEIDRKSVELDALRGELRQHEAAERRTALRRSHDELTQRLAKWQVVDARLSELRDLLATTAVERGAVAVLRQLDGEIAAVSAARKASAAAITVHYESGVTRGFDVDGAPLADGASIAVEQPVHVRVAGVGSLSVAPGRLGEIEALEARLAELAARRAELLEKLSVRDLADAEARLEQTADLGNKSEMLGAELRTLAPQGLAVLEGQVREHAEQLEAVECGADGGGGGDLAVDGEDVWDVAVQEDRARLLEKELSALRRAHDALQGRVVELKLKAQEVGLKLKTVAQQLEDFDRSLPAPGERVAWLASLGGERETAQAALNAAVRDCQAWRETAPDDAAFAALSANLTALAEAKIREAEDLKSLQMAISKLEGGIQQLREDDVAARMEELEAAHARAAAAVRDYEAEVAAHVLIEREVVRAEEALKDRVLGPIMERLAPLAARVLDGAELRLEGPLDVGGIARADRSERIEDLSDGTREQIAVLVRLAYARMFADQGRPVPLILDDALVFSDDQRLHDMFAELRAAAAHHQVLVMTCHDRSFRPLLTDYGAVSVVVGPWEHTPVERAG